MSENGNESNSDAQSDGAASQDLATGRAGEAADATGGDRSDGSSYSYSSDPVTGERLGGDLSERFNDQSAASASGTDVQGSAQGRAEQSTGSSDSGSAQASRADTHAELPDYAKETYRTDDDERYDDTHHSSHGFSHG